MIADISQLLDLHAIQAERGKRSLKHFMKSVWHIVEPGTPFVDGWVIDALCEHLEALTFGGLRKLVINIPPRHTKSTIVSVIWPVWDWLHKPEDRFLCASYSLDLSTRDNRRKRNVIEDEWFQARYGSVFQITSDQNTKRFFENSAKGYHMAVSVDGATTGHGGSKLVLDDPHSASEAYSEADREAALRWFREVWSNRLNDQNKDCMVVVGQRIHERDVCGYILEERLDWEHLNLPAEYEPARKCSTTIGWSDPRKVEGDLLWAERFSNEALAGLKRDLGSAGYAAQYQQSPVPSGGGQFRATWIRRYSVHGGYFELETESTVKRVMKESCHFITTTDLAISEKQEADFTVFSTWAITPDKDILLLDVIRGHFSNPEQQKQARMVYTAFALLYFLIESVAYQLALIQQLRKDGLPVREFKPVKDKVARAITASVLYEAGKVYHPHVASWLVDCEKELLTFPKAAHDDFVDTVSMICEEVGGKQGESGIIIPIEHDEQQNAGNWLDQVNSSWYN